MLASHIHPVCVTLASIVPILLGCTMLCIPDAISLGLTYPPFSSLVLLDPDPNLSISTNQSHQASSTPSVTLKILGV